MHGKKSNHRRGGKIQNCSCKIAIFVFVIALCSASMAISGGDAGRESPFSLGAGARGMGLGRAFVSLGGDASTAFSNPAGTALIDRSEFAAFHTSLFLNTSYDCLALAHPVGNAGVFTLSAGRLGTGSFTGRDQYNRPDQDISASDTQLGLTYGREVGAGFATGLTIKGVGQEVGSNSGYGFGLDLGFQYRPRFANGVCLGIALNDLIQPSIKLRDIKDKYQTVSRYGLSYSRKFASSFAATGIFDVEKIVGRKAMIHPGLEMAFYDNYFLRLGYDNDRPTYGAGITYGSISLDYAYEDIQFLGGSHRISLGISFGKSVQKTQGEVIAAAVETERNSWQKTLDDKKMHDCAAYLFTADSLRSDNKYQDALFYYERALAINENSIRAQSMSDSMMTLIVANAASTARDQKREDLISNRVATALDNFKAGRLNDAISQYELALEIDPTNTTVSDLLTSARATRLTEIDNIRKNAKSDQSKADYSNALGEWNKLIALEPTDTEAKTGIETSKSELRADGLVASAVSAMNGGKYSDAVTYLNQAQVLRPKDGTIKSLLAESKAKSAPATSLSDIKADKEHWAVYLQGLEKYKASDYQKALESWESLRQFYPNNPDLEKNISQAKQRLSTESGQN
jgi:tetratricopeptide (TPR) repeat protein